MGNYDDFYDAFRQADEQRKRDNFNIFMDTVVTGLVEKLDKYYADKDMEKYDTLVNNIKTRFGAKVLRNSEGKHKLKV